MTYYDNQESVANIYVGLMERGWKCYGYKADESDSMTDYWSPASWEGIAEKNGYVLLVDVYGTSASGRKITKKTYTPDWAKIEKLQATINDKASSQNEKETSKKIIDNMMIKEHESTITVAEYPTFKNGNPKRCNWHIEKDGNIIAKGNGAFQCDGYLFHSYREETMVKVNNFIDKIEKHITGNEQLIPVVEKVVKKVIKPIETKINLNNFTKNETIIKLNSGFTGGHYKGELLQLVNVHTYEKVNRTSYTFVKLGKKYQQLKMYGSANNTLTLDSNRLEKWLQDESILTIELKEVEEVTEKTVYKKAYRDNTQKENLLESETIQEERTTVTKENKQPENDITAEAENDQEQNAITYTLGTGSKGNGIEITFPTKPSFEVRNQLKEAGYRWAGLKRNSIWWAICNDDSLKVAESICKSDSLEVEGVKQTEVKEEIIQENNNVSYDNVFDFNNKKEEKAEGNNMMDDFLSKFDNVEVKNTSRISATDEAFCQDQENIYKKAIEVYSNMLEQVKELEALSKEIGEKYKKENNGYSYPSSTCMTYAKIDTRNINEQLIEFKNRFISHIVSYFENQYNITIEDEKIISKYDENINYSNIIDEIIEQLDGYSFTEKAVEEIKEKCSDTVYRYEKITVKKNKMSISDFIYWDAWGNEKRLSGGTKTISLFKALSHFEAQAINLIYSFERITTELRKGEREYDIFDKYDLSGFNKIKSFKAFKNGKIEIEFKSNELAEQFKREYFKHTKAA
jgi:hypothetical protein